MTATQQAFQVDDDIRACLDEADLASTEIALLPDRLYQTPQGLRAGFLAGAHDLRAHLQNRGIVVEVAIPPGAKVARYDQHDATVTLPLIFWTTWSAVTAQLIAAWLEEWIRGDKDADGGDEQLEEEQPLVRYREARRDPVSGEVLAREIIGKPEEILAVLRGAQSAFEPLPPS